MTSIDRLAADALFQAQTIRNIVQAQQEDYPNSYLLEVAKDQVDTLMKIVGAVGVMKEIIEQIAPSDGHAAPDTSELEHFLTLPSRNEKGDVEV